MGAGEAWDGEIKIEEYIKKVNVGGALRMAKVDENIIWKIDELVKRNYSDLSLSSGKFIWGCHHVLGEDKKG